MGVWGPHYDTRRFSRRDVLKAAAAFACLPSVRAGEVQPESLQRQSSELLDEIERRACLYFYEQGHPVTGLVPRSSSHGRAGSSPDCKRGGNRFRTQRVVHRP